MNTVQSHRQRNVTHSRTRWRQAALAAVALLLCPALVEACLVVTGEVTISGTVSTQCVDVLDPNGKIIITNGGTLELTGTNGQNESTINRRIELSESGATLRITTTDHTFTGSGVIVGQNSGAKIEIADGKTLTSGITIEGTLQIKEVNPATDSATFVNQGLVDANTLGTLEVATDTVGDSSTATRWRVCDDDAVLLFSDGVTTATGLTGDFAVAAGALDIDTNVTTTGDLTFTGGTISVAATKSFQASQ